MTHKNSSIEKQLKELLPRLSEIFASANINFLVGSGISKPYLPTLNSIEEDINKAITDDKKAEKYKEYFQKVMLPNRNIIHSDFTIEDCFEWNKGSSSWKVQVDPEGNYKRVRKDYTDFLLTLAKLILDRKTTVIGKQVNIFTTNIDIFFETVFEELELHYSDGFLGKMKPIFDLSNFKQSIIQRSHHYDNRSEIPVFNLLKIHGSVNWKFKEKGSENPNRKIYLSADLSHIDSGLLSKTGKAFIDEYKETVLVVNPEDTKFSETVLNKYYYELLRSYSSELERETSVLFVIGFSMADAHIQEITKRAARSNPTLQIYIFIHSKEEIPGTMAGIMEVSKHPNIKIIAPEYETDTDKYNYNLETITGEIFQKITLFKESDLASIADAVKKFTSNNISDESGK